MNAELLDKMTSEIEQEREYSLRQADRMRENAELKYQNQMDLIQKLRAQLKDAEPSNDQKNVEESADKNKIESYDEKENALEQSQLFGMTDAIKKYIKEQPIDSFITMPKVYEFLISRHPELKNRETGNLRAQISSTLAKLTKQGFLVLYRKGNSSEPHIYKVVMNSGVSLF